MKWLESTRLLGVLVSATVALLIALAAVQAEQASLRSASVVLIASLLVVLPLLLLTGYRYHRASSSELRASEERFRATFEQAAVGIAHVSATGRFLRLNDRFCDIVGYTRDEMLARTFRDITHPEDLDADLEHVRQLLGGEAETYSMEKRYLRKDGEIVWVNLTVSLLRDHAGDPRWFVAAVEDVSHRKGVEAEIQEYQKRLRALAADLTLTEERERRRIAEELHDGAVQNLASARIRLDAVLKGLGAGLATEALHEVSDSLRRTALFTNRIASHLSSPSLSELGLPVAISEWMNEQLGRFGIETELLDQLEEEDCSRLDFVTRALLFRNVRELLANVVQHSWARKVRVVLRRSGDDLELVVQDDGRGCVPEAALDGGQGTHGIGLFSIRERMADLGGALRVESHPGRGCVATLVITVAPGRRPRKAESVAS